jgi:hypothetical protein
MTLSIFRALATECRRDIALLSPSLMSSVKETLDVIPTDLEVVVRAASLVRVSTTVRSPDVHNIHFSSRLGPLIPMATS